MSEKPRHAAYVPPRRRQFNIRFALILAAVFAISAGLIHVVRIYQVDQNMGLLLRLAVQQQRSGRLDEALRSYARYLAYRPNDLDALATMGQLLSAPMIAIGVWLMLRAKPADAPSPARAKGPAAKR